MSKLRMIRGALLAVVLAAAVPARAVSTDTARKLYEQASPSLVAVKYTWESELGRRELIGAGGVVREGGLVMSPLSGVDMRIPGEQMKGVTLTIAPGGKGAEGVGTGLPGGGERGDV